MIRDILDADAFWRDYDFYPDALTFGVAVRKTGATAAALRQLFAAQFAADYPGVSLAAHRARRVVDRAHTPR
jgi:hypothetical protein